MLNNKKSNATANSSSIAIANNGRDVNLNVFNRLSALPSLLNPLIEKVIEEHTPIFIPSVPIKYPSTEQKIMHNSVKVYAKDLRENNGYLELVERVVESIDNENPGSNDIFLWAINKKYMTVKKDIFIEHGIDPSNQEEALKIIRDNSDKIIQNVSEKILGNASELEAPVELIEEALNLVVCYGFINCKILEEPPK